MSRGEGNMKKFQIFIFLAAILLLAIAHSTLIGFTQPPVPSEPQEVTTDSSAITTPQKADLAKEVSQQSTDQKTGQRTPSQPVQPSPNKRRIGAAPKTQNPVLPISLFSSAATSKSFVAPSEGTEPSKTILLRVGTIDTGRGPVSLPEELQFDPAGTAPEEIIRYLVQFTGPVKAQWKEKLSDLGCKIGDYIPNNCFIVSMTSNQRNSVSELRFVQWIDYFHPAYKLSDDLVDAELLSKATLPAQDHSPTTEDTTTLLLSVQTFENNHLHYLKSLADEIPGATIAKQSDTQKSRMILQITTEYLDGTILTLAQDPEVEWIEPFVPPELHNDTMAWVVQNNVEGETTLWLNGLTGANQIVGIGDTGLDADMAFFWDENQGLPTSTVNSNQRKVISYHDLAGNGGWDEHDHGTHVAGTVAGKSLGPNTGYNGLAYDAKLVIQDIGNGGSLIGIPSDLNTYFQQAYDDGARIHSNSWGAEVYGAYTSYSRDADEFMWNHKDFFIVISAGNSGPSTATLGAPGTAKNVLTSGACENAHPGYNQENVAYFSSNGPTNDGRIKPTVTAPGYYISSADNDGNVYTFNSSIREMSGTSMSAPAHAASGALVRQYFNDGYYPTGTNTPDDALSPSSALIKAVMVNSAVNMTGTDIDAPLPSTGQGWGRIHLDNTLYFSGDDQLLIIEDDQVGLQTGESTSYSFFSDSSKPLKVTLVWTDYYPSLSSATQLVNDLDLALTGPSLSYRGNVFSGGISTTGGSFDRLNVVENILIPHPETGNYTITVSGHNIPNGPQPYALVVTGLSTGSSAGSLSLDKSYYRSDDTMIISLNDLDLNLTSGTDTATIQVSSEHNPEQQLTLFETSSPGTFRADLQLSTSLTLTDGEIITLTYTDANNGEGASTTLTVTATVDDTPPLITDISLTDIDENSVRVSWSSNETTTTKFYYKTDGDTFWSEVELTAATEHIIQLTDLVSSTLYQFKIISTDYAGNTAVADNDAAFYSFSTDLEEIFVMDDLETMDSLFQVSGGSVEGEESGLWHISDYKASSGSHAWYYGLETTKTYDTGNHNWGHITTVHPIDLSQLSNAKLRFRHTLTTENFATYDTATVQISEDNINFTTVYETLLSSMAWEEVTIDLEPFLGQSIYVRFSFDTTDEMFNNYEGWLIDDIAIVTFHKRKGDVNGDGRITLADTLLALQVVTGSPPAEAIEIRADVDGDGRIGIVEAITTLHSLSQ